MPGGGQQYDGRDRSSDHQATFDEMWPVLAEEQDGVVARRQLLAGGLTPGQARRALRSKSWRTAHPGVYYTFSGPILPRARIQAALLYAGDGAVASHRTALFLAGAVDGMPDTLDITIPHGRRERPITGVRIHRQRDLPVPAPASLPRTSVEAAVLDTVAISDKRGAVLDVVLRAVQRRLTTPARLSTALARRSRQRWRQLLIELIGETARGVLSALERRYLHRVERAHGLPCGERNRGESRTRGTSQYWDVEYEPWKTLVELDGLAYHPDDEKFRDRRKDNAGTLSGRHVLRYGWRDVDLTPCQVAAEVAVLLRSQGWPGQLQPCGPTCRARRAA